MPTYSLSDLYSATVRARDTQAMTLAKTTLVPHPLRNVSYADGEIPCTHVQRHQRFEHCKLDLDPAICELCQPGEKTLVRILRTTIEEQHAPETEWDPAWGDLPKVMVSWLTCGHTLVRD